ncbi:PTS mannitol transporter subunit IICB [Marisediminicola senii]|uniref:PTS mannitol transporter subunit IICB n=1 Tax=Marisediminicola senii TaxID=2711233 RepID=UPI0013EE26DD|nr:PTS mannitol transporter subunit IICB [Marisediminicola senii]
MTTTSAPVKKTGARVHIQRFGTFLSGMVMPNIPAFIAWGLITALFIETGWIPVGVLGGFGETDGVANIGLVGPMINYLLPLLIAYTGGHTIYGVRGGVVGAAATMGVIIGAAGTPMFLGALILGPLTAYVLKKVDSIWDGKIRAGFEMLVNNYVAGIIGFIMALVGFFGLAPVVQFVSDVLGTAVRTLTDAGLLPLASIIIEPAKVLFLNNAINQGVLTPLGVSQAAEDGKSILFLLEANPGPGLGLLVAISIFGVGIARSTAPGAIVIQFLGGIHEIYFPYVLAKPILLVALIGGGATGIATNVLFGSGLVSPASPGSIFAVLVQTARDSYLGVTLSVILSATVTFVIASLILRATRKRDLAAEAAGEDSLSAAAAKMDDLKGKKSEYTGALKGENASTAAAGVAAGAAAGGSIGTSERIQNIVFACDAGMGSSAMGASVLRNKMKKAGIDGVTVTNKSIAALDGTEDLIITQRELTDRARQKNGRAEHVSVDNFMNSPRYEEVVDKVADQNR